MNRVRTKDVKDVKVMTALGAFNLVMRLGNAVCGRGPLPIAGRPTSSGNARVTNGTVIDGHLMSDFSSVFKCSSGIQCDVHGYVVAGRKHSFKPATVCDVQMHTCPGSRRHKSRAGDGPHASSCGKHVQPHCSHSSRQS